MNRTLPLLQALLSALLFPSVQFAGLIPCQTSTDRACESRYTETVPLDVSAAFANALEFGAARVDDSLLGDSPALLYRYCGWPVSKFTSPGAFSISFYDDGHETGLPPRGPEADDTASVADEPEDTVLQEFTKPLGSLVNLPVLLFVVRSLESAILKTAY